MRIFFFLNYSPVQNKKRKREKKIKMYILKDD